MTDRLTKEERAELRRVAVFAEQIGGPQPEIMGLLDECEALEQERDASLAREDSVRSRMYEARVECAERMRKIYEALREEPSDSASIELRVQRITLEPFPWDDRDE